MDTIEKLLQKAQESFGVDFHVHYVPNFLKGNDEVESLTIEFSYLNALKKYGNEMRYSTQIFLDDKGLAIASSGDWKNLPAYLPIGMIDCYGDDDDVCLFPENLEAEYREFLQKEPQSFILKDLSGKYCHTLGGLLTFMCQEWIP